MTPQPILARIDRPQDLHALGDDELEQVAREVRAHIIDTVGEIGGHFGANLGTCELAVALHSLLDSPRDKILWDVGHQAYPHKVLTGRARWRATATARPMPRSPVRVAELPSSSRSPTSSPSGAHDPTPPSLDRPAPGPPQALR